MKKSIIALLLAGLILLSGCSTMLEREYFVSRPYTPISSSSVGGSSLRVENYQELLNAILYLVSRGEEHGVLSLYNYTAQDVENDLSRACLEVVQEDPLGSYAVDYIKHDYSLIVSYYEVNLNIAYRRSQEQLSSIISVTGSSALRQELRRALVSFNPSTTLRVSYFTEDEAYIKELVEQAYYDAPSVALGKPEVSVSLYPDSGHQRIVEVQLTFPYSADIMLQRSQDLKNLATSLTPQVATPKVLQEIILSALDITENEDYCTTYDALIRKISNSEGIALAFQLLSDQYNLPCVVVRGQLDGKNHFWNLVSEDGVNYRHVDLSAELLNLTDEELTQAGSYEWDRTAYPSASAPAEESSAEEHQEN